MNFRIQLASKKFSLLRFRGQSGMSLLSVMVAAGIGSVVVYGVSSAMTNMMSVQKNMELRSEKDSIKKYLQSSVSCQASLGKNAAATCAKGYIDLYKVVGGQKKEVVSRKGTKIGSYTVVAECNEDSDGIILRAARPVNERVLFSQNIKHFHPDPLTRVSYTLKDDQSLMAPHGTSICSDVEVSPVDVVTGTFNGDCNPFSFLYCKETKKITLPGRPVSVQIFSAPEDRGYNIFPFSALKSDSLTGAGGWQSITSLSGITLPAGPLFDAYYASVKLDEDGFTVRKALNVDYRKLNGHFNNRYHFIAHIRN